VIYITSATNHFLTKKIRPTLISPRHMATRSTKLKPPDLSATPEEMLPPAVDDKGLGGGGLGQGRSMLNLHLQERLVGGTFGVLVDENRMGRRSSVGSLSVDGSSLRYRDDDDGYFKLKRVMFHACVG